MTGSGVGCVVTITFSTFLSYKLWTCAWSNLCGWSCFGASTVWIILTTQISQHAAPDSMRQFPSTVRYCSTAIDAMSRLVYASFVAAWRGLCRDKRFSDTSQAVSYTSEVEVHQHTHHESLVLAYTTSSLSSAACLSRCAITCSCMPRI